MKIKTTLLAIVMMAFGGVASAGDYDTWYQLSPTTGDNLDGVIWEDPANPGTLVAAEAGNDYYVPAGKTLRPFTTSTFAGRTLAIAGTIKPSSPGVTYTYSDLRLLDGSLYGYNSFNNLSGQVMVEGSVSIKPFFYGSNKFRYSATFLGDENAVVNLAVITPGTREAALNSLEQITGDWSQFYGDLNIGTGTWVQVYRTSFDFGGEISVKTNAYLEINSYTKTVNLGALNLENGSEFYVNGANTVVNLGALKLENGSKFYFYDTSEVIPTMTISKDLYLEAGAKISFSTQFSTAANAKNLRTLLESGIELFKLTGIAAENPPTEASMAGVIIENFADYPFPDGLRLRVVDNGDDTKSVVLGGTPVVTMMKMNSSNGSSQPLAFESTECWSSGVIPSAEEAVTAAVTVSSMDLRACKDTVYPKLNLIIPTGATLYLQANSFECGVLTMVAGSLFCSYAGTTKPKLFGILNVYPQTDKRVGFGGWGGTSYQVYSEIRGAGDLKIGYSSATSIAAELFGTNTLYTGAICVTSTDSQWDPTAEPAVDVCATLYLNDGRNLGGACPTDKAWKALTVEKHSKVTANQDVVVTEPTRGIYVPDAARLIVPTGKVMSFVGPTTYGGEITKLGAGRLALGKAQFSDAGAEPTETSIADHNLLTVTAGTVTANDSQSFDGVAVSFASGTGLTVDAAATDADLLAYGALLTKTGSALTYADAKLKVDFCGQQNLTVSEKSVAILTVPAATAATLQLDVPSHVPGYDVTVTTRTNADTSVTYVATLSRLGLTVIIR